MKNVRKIIDTTVPVYAVRTFSGRSCGACPDGTILPILVVGKLVGRLNRIASTICRQRDCISLLKHSLGLYINNIQ